MNEIHKLYLVEGLPGVGKTTYAHRLKETLENQGRIVKLYTEGMSHPADMAWNAYLTMPQYHDFLNAACSLLKSTHSTIDEEELLERIKKQTILEEEHAIIAYTQIEFPDDHFHSLADDLSAYEVYDGRIPLAEFKQLHYRRWKKFCKKALNTTNTVYIFECAFLQNHIFELMGFYDMSDEMILSHLEKLLNTVDALNPLLMYIAPNDTDACILTTDRERRDGDYGWMQMMIDYVEKSNYGKLKGLHGTNGVIAFLKNRYRIDLLALQKLDIKSKVITREF